MEDGLFKYAEAKTKVTESTWTVSLHSWYLGQSFFNKLGFKPSWVPSQVERSGNRQRMSWFGSEGLVSKKDRIEASISAWGSVLPLGEEKN